MLMDSDRRPCHGHNCKPNACAAAHYRRIIDNHVRLTGPWAGWRLAGRDLVSPAGERINPERLRGLIFRQAAEERVARSRRCKNGTNAAGSRCDCSILELSGSGKTLPARELFAGSA